MSLYAVPTSRAVALSGAAALAAFALLVVPASARADGLIYVHDPHPQVVIIHPRWPGRPRPHFPMRVTRHRVKVEIDDTVVHTRVEETFHNPGLRQLEGTYIFPLPPGAGVSAFRMKIGGKEVSGEVLEREKARRIYEDIVRHARDPGLLEYMGRGLFRARVFPIPPRGDVEVAIEYDESLGRTAGLSEYRYPLDTGKYSAGSYENVTIDVRLHSSASLRSIHCPSHDVSIDRHGGKEARIGFEAKKLAADTDFLLQWNVGEDALEPLLVTHRGHEAHGYFYLSIAPRPASAGKAPPKDVAFVIDTSGSMSDGKLEPVKRALRYSIENLNAADRFNIVDFSTEARRFRPAIVEASEANRKAARLYVDGLRPRGGTNIEEGLRFALEGLQKADRLPIVVLLTDGEPTFGITRTPELLESVRKANSAKARIFVFGVGEDLNAKLLDLIVRENRGAAEYIRRGEDLELPISTFYDKIDAPVLTDLRLRVGGGGVSDVLPAPLPDIFKGDQLDIFGRYGDDGRKTVVIEGKYLGQPRVFEYSLEFRGAQNDHVARLWAMRRVATYLEKMRLEGESPELKSEVIRLSKQFGIITAFTSYLILEEDRLTGLRRPAGRPGVVLYHSATSDAIRAGAGGAAGGRSGGEDGVDLALREGLERAAESFGAERGAKAVESSRRLSELKRGRLASPALEPAAASTASAPAADGSARAFRAVAGRMFYLQGERWVDSLLTTGEDAGELERRRVEYLSDAYFALLSEGDEVGKLLGVGPLVTFLWKDKVVEVTPAKS